MCLAVAVAGLLLCARILHNLLKRQGQFRSEGGDKTWPLHLCPEWLDFVCRLVFKVTVTPKHTARIRNPKAQKQKEITFVLRIRHCWSAVFHAVDYVFQHSWQFLLIVMNRSWTVSQLLVTVWERKSPRNTFSMHLAAKNRPKCPSCRLIGNPWRRFNIKIGKNLPWNGV